MNSSFPSIRSLYRSYLRQVRVLPHLYLRQFFQIRARDDIQAVLSMQGENRQELKAKFICKRVRRLEKANKGNLKAFDHILDLAYGRAGKLKWELLKPFLSDINPLLPDPIIKNIEKSSSPVYSPELKALLTSPLARFSKPLNRQDLINPRSLPPRADPLSEEARLFGPFSKRREMNIRRQFYRSELKKVLPPLEVAKSVSDDAIEGSVPIRPLAMQQYGVSQDVERLVGNLFTNISNTRKFWQPRKGLEEELKVSKTLERHPSRWVRRRYRALLSRIPQLIHDTNAKKDSFRVNVSPFAHHPRDRTTNYMTDADSINLAWIQKPK